MSLHCYIIDNEDHAIELLTKHVNKTPGIELAGTETDPLVAWQKISTGEIKADITFMDIEMPQLSGLELGALIQTHTHIIFTTAYPNFALQSFDINVMDYLVKPITYQRFLKAVQKAQRLISGAPSHSGPEMDYIFVQTEIKGKKIKIKIDDIFLVESAQNYVRIILKDQNHLTYITLKEMENTLPPALFVRVHRSFLINLNKVESVEGSVVHLVDGTPVALGQGYKKDFSQRIDEHLLKSKRQA